MGELTMMMRTAARESSDLSMRAGINKSTTRLKGTYLEEAEEIDPMRNDYNEN